MSSVSNARLSSAAVRSPPSPLVTFGALPRPGGRSAAVQSRLLPTKRPVAEVSVDIPVAADAPTVVPSRPPSGRVIVHGVHHVGLICENLEASLAFYHDILGLEINPDRPDDKLPYRGAWLWIGPEMIHLMELPNPDPADAGARPQHGGRDRHFCIGVAGLDPLVAKLDVAGVPYTRSMSGRPAIFFRDPDANVIEAVEGAEPWR